MEYRPKNLNLFNPNTNNSKAKVSWWIYPVLIVAIWFGWQFLKEIPERISQIRKPILIDEVRFPKITFNTFEIPELNISFQYPSIFQDINYGVENGDTGQELRGSIRISKCVPPCSQEAIYFHSLTSDYSRAGGGDPTIGFIKKGAKYFQVTLGGYENEIDYEVKEVKGTNEVGIVLKGDNREPGPGTLSSDQRKAIFNLNNQDFKSIIFETSIIKISEYEFETILSTFKFTK